MKWQVALSECICSDVKWGELQYAAEEPESR
jgi:hypothetical protein